MYTQYVFDSASVDDYDSPTFILQSPHVENFKILSVQIPLTFYPVGNNNNVLVFKEGDTEKSVQIAHGSYNVDNFPQVLEDLLNGVSDNNYNVTYNPIRRNLSIVGDDAFQIMGLDGGSSAFKLVGANRRGASASGTEFTGRVIDLTGASSLLLTSAQLMSLSFRWTGMSSANAIALIPITSPVGSVMNWENNGSYLSFGRSLSYVSFRLIDSATFAPITFNGASFQITMGITDDIDDPVVIV